jgi:hypothetical protein
MSYGHTCQVTLLYRVRHKFCNTSGFGHITLKIGRSDLYLGSVSFADDKILNCDMLVNNMKKTVSFADDKILNCDMLVPNMKKTVRFADDKILNCDMLVPNMKKTYINDWYHIFFRAHFLTKIFYIT